LHIFYEGLAVAFKPQAQTNHDPAMIWVCRLATVRPAATKFARRRRYFGMDAVRQ